MEYKKIQGLKKIKELGLPFPPYGIIEWEKVTRSEIKKAVEKLGIPNIEGDRLGVMVRTSNPKECRTGGRSDLHLDNIDDVIKWTLELKDKNEPDTKFIIQHVVDAKCSGVMLKNSSGIIAEIVLGDAPSLLEGKTSNIERWIYRNNEWGLESEEYEEKILNEHHLNKLVKYSKLVPDDSYLEWSLSKDGNFYFYEFMEYVKGKPIDLKPHEAISGEVVVYGLRASPGIASGIARVLTDLNNIQSVNKGEVLVIKDADRHVVHVVKKISALVAERGGVTSHASIIAREFGVPCVVGAENATNKIKTGDKVVVDGSKGIVALV